MTFRRKAALAVTGILAAGSLAACQQAPGPASTKTWCDHGNRLYSLDTEETRGETLAVVPEAVDCPPPSESVTIRPQGDTRPMPEVEGVQEGPYKPWKPSVKPRKSTVYRLMPETR